MRYGAGTFYSNAFGIRGKPPPISVALALLCAITVSWSGPCRAAEPVAIAVADFDYSDTSGEVTDQSAAHRARVAAFAELLRQDLGRDLAGAYRVVPLDCPAHPCTAGSMPPDEFVAQARRAGAHLVVYGGIRKMSTLVQWGEVQLLDLERNKLLLQRTVTFRGDTDLAFRRAAGFVGETLKEVMPN